MFCWRLFWREGTEERPALHRYTHRPRHTASRTVVHVAADVHNDGEQAVRRVGAGWAVRRRVGQLEVKGEGDAVRQLALAGGGVC